MRTRHVLAYLDSDEVGGAEHCLRSVVGNLAVDYRFTVAGVNANVVAWVATGTDGVEQLVLPAAPTKTSLRAGRAHVQAFRRAGPDIVHISLRHPYACQWGTVAGLLTPAARILAVEQLPIPPANALQARIKRQLVRGLDAHVAVGRGAARDLESWVGLRPDSVGTVYNARSSDPIRRVPSQESALRCVAVGRLHDQKGFDLLIDALADVADVTVRIVGDGVERANLEAQAAARGVSDRVRFVGWIDDPAAELSRADTFVLPSRYEGLPLSIIEAMFAELPVVAADVGSVRELVLHGETGLLVPPNDAAAVATALRDLAGDRERRSRLGAAGRDRALAHFSLDTMLDRYRELYEALLA